MQADFWHDRWQRQQIGFHEPAANPLLLQHFDTLALPSAARILLPLCGKTLDIDWLLARGHEVVGAELSAIAVAALFERLQEFTVDMMDDLAEHEVLLASCDLMSDGAGFMLAAGVPQATGDDAAVYRIAEDRALG